jgi:LAS superfamily LD-carboxypeptidase LdcB
MERLIFPLMMGLLILSAIASQAQPTDEQIAQVQERMAEMRERLELTDEQVAELEPIITTAVQHQQAVMEKHGVSESGSGSGRPNPRKLMQMRSDMDAVRQETSDQVRTVLNDDQYQEFLKIQEERKAERRARMREGRG